MIDKLLILYRILNLYYKLDIKCLNIFLRFLYTLDSIRIRDALTPYIWEDYIFINDKIFNIFINQNKFPFKKEEFNKISEFDREILNNIIINKLVIDYDIDIIDHLDFIPENKIEVGAIDYYLICRENHFLFYKENYESDLRELKR